MPSRPKATEKARSSWPQITVLESVNKPDPEIVAKALAPIFLDWLIRKRKKSNDKDPDTKD